MSNNQLEIPHTPRGSSTANSTTNNQGLSSYHKTNMTPSFTFGLSFSPSFSFQSPLQSVSPHKFFNASNNLNRVMNRKLTENDKMKTFSPRGLTRTPSKFNKFIDSLTRAQQKSNTNSDDDAHHDDSIRTQEDDLDLWSSLENDSHSQSHNLTSLTSIYEEEDSSKHEHGVKNNNNNNSDDNNTFLTPDKLLLSHKNTNNHNNTNDSINIDIGNRSGNASSTDLTASIENKASPNKLQSAPPLVSIKPKIEALGKEHSPSKLEMTVTKSIKRRKLMSSNSVTDSPNNSIASQIDSAMDSPLPRRKQSVDSIGDSGDKVWYAELDDVLIKSYLKYRDFRENHAGYNSSSILKHTSQNKVLSRMLLNKTGILRTSKQISSRLFRLSKLKKLDKNKSSNKTPQGIPTFESCINDEIDDLISTPLESLMASNSSSHLDSVATNEIIDHELDILLASPPDDCLSLDDHVKYSMHPQEFKIAFKSTSPNDNHVFSSLNNITSTSMSTDNFQTKYGGDDTVKIVDKLRQEAVPVWILSHELNLNLNNRDLVTSTPISPFTSQVHGDTQSSPLNLLHGALDSYSKISVQGTSETRSSMLAWKCYTKVYNSKTKQVLLENVEALNAYYNLSNKTYNLQFPFLKNFFAGYLNFLINGTSNKEGDSLRIAQVMYKNNNELAAFDPKNSNIYSYFIHEVSFSTSGANTGTHINMVKLVEGTKLDVPRENHLAVQGNLAEEDDNETVMADSSPYKPSPKSSINDDSPIRRGSVLTIDVNKANIAGKNLAMNQSPVSAPIYNAEIVQKFNQNLLKQQEPIRSVQSTQIPDISTNLQVVDDKKKGVNNNSSLLEQITENLLEDFNRSNSNINFVKASTAPNSVMLPPSQSFTIEPSTNNSVVPTIEGAGISNFSNSQVVPPSQQPFMVNLGNGFVPFNTLHPNVQEQFMSVHRQFDMRRPDPQVFLPQQQQNQQPTIAAVQKQIQQIPQQSQPLQQHVQQQFQQQSQQLQQQTQQQQNQQLQMQLQQQLQQQYQQVQQTQQYMYHNSNINSAPASQTQFFIPQNPQIRAAQQQTPAQPLQQQIQFVSRAPVNVSQRPGVSNPQLVRSRSSGSVAKESNKENFKPKEIKFGPILEYDPSKDSKSIQSGKTIKQGTGIHRFPINTPVSIYKPKKK